MSGEKQGVRESMDRMISQMVKSGQNPEYAKKVARDQAIKNEIAALGEDFRAAFPDRFTD